MKPTKIYDVVVPAGGSFQLQALGDYFKILSATADLEVRGDTFGTIGVIRAGQGLRNTPFGRLEFRDTSGFANAVRVLVGDSDFVDERITGTVDVLDGGRARTQAGAAFSGLGYQIAVAANFSCVQLWNPAASGSRLILGAVMATSQVLQGVNGAITAVRLTVAHPGMSKLSGGATGAGLRCTQVTPVGSPLVLYPNVAIGGVVPAGGGWSFKFVEPIVINPGYGFTLNGATVNADLGVTFEWFEEKL